MAALFAVSAELEVEFVNSATRKRGFNGSWDDHNPFDAYSPSDAVVPR